ncbi:MAG: hypothetical protein RH946_14465 [Rhodospirillales bacterium]
MREDISTWIKPALMGGLIGAIAITIIGFSSDIVVSKGDAMRQAEEQANREVLSALTPICVTQFKQLAQNQETTHLAALKEKGSWEQGDYVEKQGWATMPGSNTPNDDVAEACAEALLERVNKTSS